MISKWSSAILFLSLVALSSISFGRDLVDWEADPANPRPQAEFLYTQGVEHLKTGEIISVGSAGIFQIEHVARNSENNTVILKAYRIIQGRQKTTRPVAIRLPTSHKSEPKYYTNQTISGYSQLKNQNINTPRLLAFKKSKYTIVEWIDFSFDLSTFIKATDLEDPEIAKAEQSLYRFAKSSAAFWRIGDFKPDQLVYSGERDEWYLLDWTSFHYSWPFSKIAPSRNPFNTSYFKWGLSLLNLTSEQTARWNRISAGIIKVVEESRSWPIPNCTELLKQLMPSGT